MSKYRKLIVAGLAAALIALDQFFGISLAMNAESIVAFAVPILTAFGVWAVPNVPA